MRNKDFWLKMFFWLLIGIIGGIIFFYQTKKEGFHEDEIYSLGSAVNPYDGLLSSYGVKDTTTIMFEKYVNDANMFKETKNMIHYVTHGQDYQSEIDELNNKQFPVWKTKEEVRDYITLKNENLFNFKALYINQAKDNHPPLFYTLVHFSSILFGGSFSKYTVFVVNILVYIGSCFLLKKILNLLDKNHLLFPVLIFYGLSMGTISMVLYQRMYMLLTSFILLYYYFCLVFYKNDFQFTKSLKWKMGITAVLGFLTQYFFAIFAFFLFGFLCLKMIKEHKYKEMKSFIIYHLVWAILGILLFVPSIYHLFFTDRGLTNLNNQGYFKNLIVYIHHLLYAFSISSFGGILVLAFLLFCLKKIGKNFMFCFTFIPGILYFFLVVKMTSFQELRYIMPLIPFLSLSLFFFFDILFTFKYKNIVLLLFSCVAVLNGFIFSKPQFLYTEYKNCLTIASQNREKSFVYVYDNFFNHLQSVPEMLLYKRTMIINVNKNEEKYFLEDESLNQENDFILAIKSYLDNENILHKIKENTDFKTCTLLYGVNSKELNTNLYLCSK